MSDDCCHPSRPSNTALSQRFRRALWVALVVNVAMFFVEVISGWRAGSVSLLADAVDFFGDSANYAVSLFVFSLGMTWRSRTALIKGVTMGVYGMYILVQAAWSAAHPTVPQAGTMGVVGIVALVANVSVAALLYAYREGDADMRSVWLCSRNDAIGNLAVLLAALGVFGTQRNWPDLVVAAVMALLALSSARSIVARARRELRRKGPGHANVAHFR